MKKFIQYIFSIRNKGNHKILTIVGIKFKFKKYINSKNPLKVNDFGQNNEIYTIDIFGNKKKFYNNSDIKIIVTGNNNKIYIAEDINFLQTRFEIHSDNNEVVIKKTPHLVKLFIHIKHGNNQKILIDEKFSSGGCRIYCLEEFSKVVIGNDCMFSTDIDILSSDCHCVFDANDENTPINFGKGVKINDHCWIGKHVKILKNVEIPKNSICGMSTVVSKTFKKENIIIAGNNPARIVKENINWKRDLLSLYKN